MFLDAGTKVLGPEMQPCYLRLFFLLLYGVTQVQYALTPQDAVSIGIVITRCNPPSINQLLNNPGCPTQLFVFHLEAMSTVLRQLANHLLITTIARIENCAPFIGTPQLYCRVPDFRPSTFRTGLLDDSFILHITPFHCLYGRSLLSKKGRERGGFRCCGNGFRGSICTRMSFANITRFYHRPLFSAPQQSQISTVFLLPVELSSRLPQSVQKTRDPIADILAADECLVVVVMVKIFSARAVHEAATDPALGARLQGTSEILDLQSAFNPPGPKTRRATTGHRSAASQSAESVIRTRSNAHVDSHSS